MPGAPQFDPSIGQKHIIERPRLLKLLDETEAKIILLVAPAGYGKTTLARQWLRTCVKPRLWVRGRDDLVESGWQPRSQKLSPAKAIRLADGSVNGCGLADRRWMPRALQIYWSTT